MGGYAIQSSIDSYVLSLLVETGIPRLIFFAGSLLLSIWYWACGIISQTCRNLARF